MTCLYMERNGEKHEKRMEFMDLYSRYLFETAVFEQSQNKFLMADDLNKVEAFVEL